MIWSKIPSNSLHPSAAAARSFQISPASFTQRSFATSGPTGSNILRRTPAGTAARICFSAATVVFPSSKPHRFTPASASHSQAAIAADFAAITTCVPTASALAWAV